jgi:hypothetical protein
MVPVSFVNGLCIGLLVMVVVAMVVWSHSEINSKEK